MKKLIVSMKSTEDMFYDFRRAAKRVKAGKSPKSPHYEISFESKKEFEKFVRNISTLMTILHSKPKSIYQLAKMTNKDLSNMKKTVAFLEEIGALHIEEKKVSGRTVKIPVVDYDKVEFDLGGAA